MQQGLLFQKYSKIYSTFWAFGTLSIIWVIYLLYAHKRSCKVFFLFSLSLYTLLYTMFLLNTHARTILLVFFRFQDICHWFDFRSIKMMYPMATIPFPSLWRHQMICLLGQTETLKPNTWFKHTNNMLTHAHGSINNARDCRLQEINQIVLLKLIKRHY